MKTVKLQDVKKRGKNALPKTGTALLISNNDAVGAYLPIKEYQLLMEVLEDYEDKLDIKKRKAEPNISEEDFWQQLEKVANE